MKSSLTTLAIISAAIGLAGCAASTTSYIGTTQVPKLAAQKLDPKVLQQIGKDKTKISLKVVERSTFDALPYWVMSNSAKSRIKTGVHYVINHGADKTCNIEVIKPETLNDAAPFYAAGRALFDCITDSSTYFQLAAYGADNAGEDELSTVTSIDFPVSEFSGEFNADPNKEMNIKWQFLTSHELATLKHELTKGAEPLFKRKLIPLALKPIEAATCLLKTAIPETTSDYGVFYSAGFSLFNCFYPDAMEAANYRKEDVDMDRLLQGMAEKKSKEVK
ncbi:hypothetical protein D9H04_07895 [Escherichia coli]|nr:hypothetical protein [Escherichia coli]EEW2469473.1 hypothetical protein [Escherichia coli]EGI4643096.1 hypothetical protein [Escherichia coli]MGR07699.1 hypothetical protein [Escherichia coli]MHT44882.1 hypothetical protein [Escherichia coli]